MDLGITVESVQSGHQLILRNLKSKIGEERWTYHTNMVGHLVAYGQSSDSFNNTIRNSKI